MLTSRLFSGLALLSAFAIGGCGSDLPTGVIARELDGSWTRLDEVPGSSERWNLSTRDTVVTGTGTWSGEACCGGTLTVSGYVKGDSVHLLVIHVVTSGSVPLGPFGVQFNGTLTSPTMLVGDGGRFMKD